MELTIIIFVLILGLILGSFLNCLIWRLKQKDSLLKRSYCPKCLHQIAWYDNIPLLSFVSLKAKCRHCQKNISWQYPLVEFFFALIFVLIFLVLSKGQSFDSLTSANFLLSLTRDWLFLAVLTVVFVYDLNWQEVPMIIVWPAIVVIAILSCLITGNIVNIFISMFIASSFFFLQYWITRKRGLGEGDIWLGALLGARFIDLQVLALAIFASYMIGSLVASFLLIKKKRKMKSKVPLGPFLVLGSLIALFFSDIILQWYLGLF